MARRYWTRARLIAALQAAAKRFGACQRIYREQFGSWPAAVRAAGLQPRRVGHLIHPESRGRRKPRPKQHHQPAPIDAAARARTEEKREWWIRNDAGLSA